MNKTRTVMRSLSKPVFKSFAICWCFFNVFFYNTHLGYSLYFTVVCLCHITRGVPPPSGGIVGKNRSALNILQVVPYVGYAVKVFLSPALWSWILILDLSDILNLLSIILSDKVFQLLNDWYTILDGIRSTVYTIVLIYWMRSE